MSSEKDKEFVKVFVEFEKHLPREEAKVLHEKFNAFDKNGDAVIDLQELKMAQEKLGKAKTHQEVVDLMNQMASDPKKGITFRDFVIVQLLSKGIKIEHNIGKEGGYVDIPPVVSMFVKQVEDFSVSGIKNFFEEKNRLAQEAKAREELLKQGKSEEAKRKQKEREELERIKAEEEKKKKEHEAKRNAFKDRFANFDKKPMDDDTKKEVKKGIDGDVVKFDKGGLKPTETKEKTGLDQLKTIGKVETFDKGGLKHAETKEKTGLDQIKTIGKVEAFDKTGLKHTETKEKTGLTQAKVVGSVGGFNKDKLKHAETKELTVEERVKLAKESEKLEEQVIKEEIKETQ
jgi:hypothetical protein